MSNNEYKIRKYIYKLSDSIKKRNNSKSYNYLTHLDYHAQKGGDDKYKNYRTIKNQI